jgi:hypothetical protein
MDKEERAWLPLAAGRYIEVWFNEHAAELTFFTCLGLVEAWDAYMHGGRKGLENVRARAAAKTARAWVEFLEPHYAKRAWHEAEVRIMGVIARELARQSERHIRALYS